MSQCMGNVSTASRNSLVFRFSPQIDVPACCDASFYKCASRCHACRRTFCLACRKLQTLLQRSQCYHGQLHQYLVCSADEATHAVADPPYVFYSLWHCKCCLLYNTEMLFLTLRAGSRRARKEPGSCCDGPPSTCCLAEGCDTRSSAHSRSTLPHSPEDTILDTLTTLNRSGGGQEGLTDEAEGQVCVVTPRPGARSPVRLQSPTTPGGRQAVGVTPWTSRSAAPLRGSVDEQAGVLSKFQSTGECWSIRGGEGEPQRILSRGCLLHHLPCS
jgi:hypothetical protein